MYYNFFLLYNIKIARYTSLVLEVLSSLASCPIPYTFQGTASTSVNSTGIFTFTAHSCKKDKPLRSSKSGLRFIPSRVTNKYRIRVFLCCRTNSVELSRYSLIQLLSQAFELQFLRIFAQSRSLLYCVVLYSG